jgi:hypothetical protein
MRRGRAIPIAFAACAVGAAPAGATTLSFDRPCYLAKSRGFVGQAVNFTGAGFTPRAPVTASVSGVALVSGKAGASGEIAGFFTAPPLGSNVAQGSASLSVSDGTNSASQAFPETNLTADFSPSQGNPKTLRVRFRIFGFGPLLTALGEPADAQVYEHVIDPKGKLRGTFKAGRPSGPCGLVKPSRRKILPFKATNGRWRYVFDISRKSRKSDLPRASVAFVVRTIFKAL